MELSKVYDARQVEERWYARWLESGAFGADPAGAGAGRPAYCITIPPPNITGSLHIGHALNSTVLDILTRWRRMAGDLAVCVPGTDHAGIATQNVVEREIARQGLTRHDLGREAFVERCWEWRREYGDRIYLQMHRLGCSFDWSRARFTLDASYVDAIYHEFLEWWRRGLIYRGARVVNWCPRCRSAISDIEVNAEERAGKLYHFRYPFADGSGHVVVATTRPETMLGDTAVAVNPADERYAGLVGKVVRLPLAERDIPLIADEYARMDFGTGAVKVTPAHDLDDFECGLRHALPQVVVITEDGAMAPAAGEPYAGMDRFAAREAVLRDIAARGLLERTEDYTVKTPLCDRCKSVLEPLLSEQWFVKQAELARPAAEAVRDGRIRFHPERYAATYLHWLDNIRDWCISRQLWWGHRIPVWWTDDGRYAAGRNVDEAATALDVDPASLRQDADVLDTWFSSALWPQAVLGWPAQTPDLRAWYPTNVLATAQEILYLWVARMVMTGLDFVGDVPFRDVYITPTVLDERGERMSKSKGNGVDPLDMADRYGADALRFALMQQTGMNQDLRFSEERVRLAGAFCNKLWNASRFVLMSLAETASRQGDTIEWPVDRALLTTPDRWILSRLTRCAEAVRTAFESYRFDEAARSLYAFLWDDFCDWYVELAKPRLRSDDPGEAGLAASVLRVTLETTLRLMHPMMPHITEAIWQALQPHDEHAAREALLMVQPFPEPRPGWVDPHAEDRMALVIDATRALRNLRAEAGIPPGARLRGAAVAGVGSAATTLSENTDTIAHLARLSEIGMRDAAPTTDGRWIGAPIRGAEVFVDIGDALDIPKELERLARERAAVERDIERASARLGNPQFVQRAPADVVAKERANIEALQGKRAKLQTRAALLGG
ncbi:MAG TPA: valine--tRNA ligase [Chthonomonadales bacterium]|nr:valine--tRNA ligase [Chthonomonadales bacterium]